MAATSAESMPPDRPITTSEKPFLRTKSRVPSTSASLDLGLLAGERIDRGGDRTGLDAGDRRRSGPLDDRERSDDWTRFGQVEVDDDQTLVELRRPGDDASRSVPTTIESPSNTSSS